jgi:hypothetical protein
MDTVIYSTSELNKEKLWGISGTHVPIKSGMKSLLIVILLKKKRGSLH